LKFLKKLFVLALVVALAGLGYFLLRDMTAPELTVTPAQGPLSPRVPLKVDLQDPGLGLRSFSVAAIQDGRQIELLVRQFPPETKAAEETIDLAKAGLKEGAVSIRLKAEDRALFRFGHGNVVERTLNYQIDSKPPQISILTRHHNFNQGGAGATVYTVSEDVKTTGIRVGDLFFPGYRQPSGNYVCLFAFPWNMEESDFVPKVVATDPAGNQQIQGIYYHDNPRSFPSDRINISQSFLDNKIVPTFQHLFPEVTDPLELFLKVNGQLRRSNLATLHELSTQTSPTPLWKGAFLRQPRSASPGSFAQPRTYYYNGKVIDHQTHLGMDLASTAHAPVLAANSGKVIHAGDLGIYGQCVVIDHGLGLQTLYGHMSQLAVQVGDTVEKSQTIGHTGSTGLAGGDHLHFDVLVGGVQVNPIEWLDPHWVKVNIADKLDLASGKN
jgi:murein DD-endopeptidase MepM/ murein hydrolase activator NlpD